MHRKACNEVKWDEKKKMKNSKPSTSKWLLVTFAEEVNPLFWTVITRQRENHKKMKIKEGN